MFHDEDVRGIVTLTQRIATRIAQQHPTFCHHFNIEPSFDDDWEICINIVIGPEDRHAWHLETITRDEWLHQFAWSVHGAEQTDILCLWISNRD